jgi:hypothetical protein
MYGLANTESDPGKPHQRADQRQYSGLVASQASLASLASLAQA